jgi:ElaB/YqjD/DUF883 family membrane-anchored ribosome-binding protein
MFFSYLGLLPRESQTQFLDNWNKMKKKQENEINALNAQRLKIETIKMEQYRSKKAQQKKLAEQEKFMEYIRENPPKTFGDMMAIGPIMGEYYRNKNEVKKLKDSSTQYNESDIEESEPEKDESKSWFSW